jgi:hypothetical protein
MPPQLRAVVSRIGPSMRGAPAIVQHAEYFVAAVSASTKCVLPVAHAVLVCSRCDEEGKHIADLVKDRITSGYEINFRMIDRDGQN